MPTRKQGERPDTPRTDAPRTDLPPRREPYDEGYFGTEEEEGVQGSREATEEELEKDDGEEPRD